MRRDLVLLVVALASLASIVLVEHLGLRGTRLIECLVILALSICAAWASSSWLRNAALVLCSLAFGLAVVQALAPLLFPKVGGSRPAAVTNDNLVASRDVLGWGPRHPGVFRVVKTAEGGHVIFDVHATIDDTRNRKTVPSRGARPIAFFGDSFIFGDGLNDAETLPQAFADLNQGKIPVLNFGFSGWAPSQNLAALEKGLYKADLVAPRRMILFTSLFHIERTSCRGAFAFGSGPRYVLDGNGVKYDGTCVGSRPKFVLSILQFVRGLLSGSPSAPNDTVSTARDVETYIKIIEAFAQTAQREYHTGTTVLMEPGQDEYVAGTGYNQAKIIAALRAAGLDVLVKADPPAGSERLYQIEDDGHPTGLANKVTAEQLEEHLQRVDPRALELERKTDG